MRRRELRAEMGLVQPAVIVKNRLLSPREGRGSGAAEERPTQIIVKHEHGWAHEVEGRVKINPFPFGIGNVTHWCRLLLAVVFLLVTAPLARADQYDVVLGYASLSAAAADPVIQNHMDQLRQLFSTDRVLPDIKVWRPSQDTINGDGSITHNYLAGYFLLVSLPRLVPALRDNAAVKLVINRDLANLSQAGAVVRSTVGAVVLQDIRFEPVFAGSSYPWGNWQ